MKMMMMMMIMMMKMMMMRMMMMVMMHRHVPALAALRSSWTCARNDDADRDSLCCKLDSSS